MGPTAASRVWQSVVLLFVDLPLLNHELLKDRLKAGALALVGSKGWLHLVLNASSQIFPQLSSLGIKFKKEMGGGLG